MLTAFGVGEAAISVSSAPGGSAVRSSTPSATWGRSPTPCARSAIGDVVGVRGPFGTDWGVGRGLADGRPATWSSSPAGSASPHCAVPSTSWSTAPVAGRGRVVRHRRARQPDQIIFDDDLEAWRAAGARGRRHRRRRPAGVGRARRAGDLVAGRGRLRPGPDHRPDLRARDHDAVHRPGPGRPGRRPDADPGLARTQHAVRRRPGAATASSAPSCSAATGPCCPTRASWRAAHRARAMSDPDRRRRPAHAWPCGSSPPATAASSASSTARTSCWRWPARCGSPISPRCRGPRVAGPYDLSLVEGSITHRSRRRPHPGDPGQRHGGWSPSGRAPPPAGSRACATSRPPGSYAADGLRPPRVHRTRSTTSTPISDHVDVDFELHGCPIDRHQLLEVITAALAGRKPVIPGHSVCQECKGRGTVCLLVARGTPCLGPVTRTGLRRAVPVRRPGLLRLLRPGRHRQHRVPGGRSCAAREPPGRRVPARSRPSTPPPRPSGTSPRPRRPGAGHLGCTVGDPSGGRR